MAGKAKKPRKKQTTRSQKAIKEEILENIKTGMTIEAAALLAGVARSTYYGYREKDPKFAEAADQASRFAEAVFLERIKQAAMDRVDWKAWAWILEKRFPDDYGKRQELQVNTTSASDGTAEVLSMMEQIKSLRNTPDSTEDEPGGST
jgi:hypothetical protein